MILSKKELAEYRSKQLERANEITLEEVYKCDALFNFINSEIKKEFRYTGGYFVLSTDGIKRFIPELSDFEADRYLSLIRQEFISNGYRVIDYPLVFKVYLD